MRSTTEVFLWLAGYQTRGWSRARIADAVDVTRNAVAMRIGSLADELKIKLRPNETHDQRQTAAGIRLELEAARKYERAGKSFLDAKI
jgi:hypothetical protein